MEPGPNDVKLQIHTSCRAEYDRHPAGPVVLTEAVCRGRPDYSPCLLLWHPLERSRVMYDDEVDRTLVIPGTLVAIAGLISVTLVDSLVCEA